MGACILARVPSPEVSNLTDQYIRIHDSLRAVGLRADHVLNSHGEPVAVAVPNAFEPRHAASNIPLQRSVEAPYGPLVDDHKALKDHFPMSGPLVYPRYVLDIVDIVCRAAADTPNGLAHELKSPTESDSFGIRPQNFTLGLHVDYAASSAYLSEGLEMHGLNIHLTRYGSYIAELGIVRKFFTPDDVERAKDDAEEAGESRYTALASMYRELGAPFVRTPVMKAGDILIFQARQHVERGIPAVAHNFVTKSKERRSDTIRPHLGHTGIVAEQRQRLAEDYSLKALGY